MLPHLVKTLTLLQGVYTWEMISLAHAEEGSYCLAILSESFVWKSGNLNFGSSATDTLAVLLWLSHLTSLRCWFHTHKKWRLGWMIPSQSFILSFPSYPLICHEGLQRREGSSRLVLQLAGCPCPIINQSSWTGRSWQGLFLPIVGYSPRNHGLDYRSWLRSIWGYKFGHEGVPF